MVKSAVWKQNMPVIE